MKALARQPMSILGSLGLLGLVSDLVNWQSQLGDWILAWRTVTHEAVHFAFGWLTLIFPWSTPTWWADYLAVGFLVHVAWIRATVFANPLHERITFAVVVVAAIEFVRQLPLNLIAWQRRVYQAWVLGYRVPADQEADGRGIDGNRYRLTGQIFFESIIWALALIVFNFVFQRQ